MFDLLALQPVDYLVIGHLAVDRIPSGKRLGGTSAYAALTAQALGLRAGIVTSSASDMPLESLEGIPVYSIPASTSTTFENVYLDSGRTQVLHARAETILPENIPQVWSSAPIIHLAPIAAEIQPDLAAGLSATLLGVTPQGWLRTWDDSGRVHAIPWEGAGLILPKAGAVVLSMEDVARDLEQIERIAHQTRILCVTEGAAGSVVYWNGDRRRFRAPSVNEVDSTGAGDIFAAAFFVRLYNTRDPWEAARFATQVASLSVARSGLDGIPSPKEIEDCLMEVLP